MVDYILSQAYGYCFALILGAAFAVMMIGITHILKKYMGEVQDSERFSTASRSVKPGLISSAVVSSWAWPATLLLSGSWSYTYGIAGVYWYAIIGSVQIVFFSALALEIKLIAPGAHTVAEIVRVRFGKAGHTAYLGYSVAVNILVTSTLLLGGAQGFSAATGMHVIAGCFLLPLGVLIYTLVGGIKATFISDWIHTVIIYIVITATMFAIYTTSSTIGSPSKMYDLLKEAGGLHPATGGHEGSYLTLGNPTMCKVAWSTCIGGFVTVFGDPSYGQKAISASSKGVMVGYMLGGLCWFIIPWALGSSAGLATRALLNNPVLFTYPNPLTTAQAGAGLPLFYGMATVFGKSGAAAALLMLFMSVTSAMSAELVAFSSIVTYDMFRAYYDPSASGKKLVYVSHLSVVFFAFAMGGFAVVLNYVGVNVGWILSFKGIVLAPSVGALALSIFWPRMNKWGLIIGAPLGTATGVAVWIGSTYRFYNGDLTVTTLVGPNPALTANFVALFSAPIYAYILSFIDPQNFDMSVLNKGFKAGDDADQSEIQAMVLDKSSAEYLQLKKLSKIGRGIAITFFLVFMFIIPMPLLGTNYICSKGLFTAWIVIIFIWLMLVTAYITIYPIYESWSSLMSVRRLLFDKQRQETIESCSIQYGSKADVLDSKRASDSFVAEKPIEITEPAD